MENWVTIEPKLRAQAKAIEKDGKPLDVSSLRAPLPRAWQWLDGSAFDSHGDLMQKVFGLDPIESDQPLMYQGISDKFYGPLEDVLVPSTDLGIDFEGEYAVIVDEVPMGVSAEDAMQYIRLIVQINDWSLRTLAPIEMKTGFGWVQAKPACSAAPFAVTPEELGSAWKNGRVCLPLRVEWNGEHFGSPVGDTMSYSFHELVAHAARTRQLVAGTIIGSGTVSNDNYREIGSSCVSERRAIELLDSGKPITDYMQFGDRVRMEALDSDGGLLFGVIDQQVIQA